MVRLSLNTGSYFISMTSIFLIGVMIQIIIPLANAQEDICDICLSDPSTCPPECMDTTDDTQTSGLCGNGICEENEKTTCPQDCPSQEECVEYWVCTEWSACDDGVQTRYCVDNNKCGTTNNKPSETRACEASLNQQTGESSDTSSIGTSDTSQDLNEQTTQQSGKEMQTQNREAGTPYGESGAKQSGGVSKLLLFAISITLVFVGIAAYYLISKKKSERKAGMNPEKEIGNADLASLDEWIMSALERGYSAESIEQALISHGWDSEVVRERISKLTGKY